MCKSCSCSSYLTDFLFSFKHSGGCAENIFLQFYLFRCLLIWLRWVWVVAHRLQSVQAQWLPDAGSLGELCGLQSAELPCSIWDLSSLTGDQTWIPCIARWVPNHRTSREVPGISLVNSYSLRGKQPHDLDMHGPTHVEPAAFLGAKHNPGAVHRAFTPRTATLAGPYCMLGT